MVEDELVNPDLTNTWEIDNIQDGARFLEFVLSHVREGDMWVMQGSFDEDMEAILSPLSPDLSTIALSADNVRNVQELIRKNKWFARRIFHLCIGRGAGLLRVSPGADLLLVSYDSFCHCWLSKRIDFDTMTAASTAVGFEFADHAGYCRAGD